MFPESHETESWGERTTLTAPDEAMQNLSWRQTAPEKAQHDPHEAWFLISPLQSGNSVLKSYDSGRSLTSSSSTSTPSGYSNWTVKRSLICSSV